MNSKSSITEPAFLQQETTVVYCEAENDNVTNNYLCLLAVYPWCLKSAGKELPLLVWAIICKYLHFETITLLFDHIDSNIYVDLKDNNIVLWVKSFWPKRRGIPNLKNIDMEYYLWENCINNECLCLRNSSEYRSDNDNITYYVNILYTNCQHLQWCNEEIRGYRIDFGIIGMPKQYDSQYLQEMLDELPKSSLSMDKLITKSKNNKDLKDFIQECHWCMYSKCNGVKMNPSAQIQHWYNSTLSKQQLQYVESDNLQMKLNVSQNETQIDFGHQSTNCQSKTICHKIKLHIQKLNYFPILFVSSCYACHIYLQEPEATGHLLKIGKTLNINANFFFDKYVNNLWTKRLM